MTPISAFPAALLRPILCGGGNLPPAYGPLLDSARGLLWMGDPGRAIDHGLPGVQESPESCHIPLDPASPWPARLAQVAVWMITGWAPPFASVDDELLGLVVLSQWRGPWQEPERWSWVRRNGRASSATFDLPTLAEHRSNHPLHAALLLALYDVPEIRARMEPTP